MTHPVLKLLQSNSAEERRSACIAAANDPSATLLAEPLIETLGDPIKMVARAASDALVDIARGPGGVTRPLKNALQSKNIRQRWGAAFTRARIEPPDPALLPAIIEALASTDGDVRWTAIHILVEIGRTHNEILGVIIALIKNDQRSLVRRMATFALGKLAPDRPETSTALIQASRDTDVQVRRAALTATATLQDPSSEVIENLIGTLENSDDSACRRLAAMALAELRRDCLDQLTQKELRALQTASENSKDPKLAAIATRSLALVRSDK